MKLECPVCGSELIHERIDDGIIVNRITKSGEVIEIANDSNGHDTVQCSEKVEHKLSDELINKILEMVQ